MIQAHRHTGMDSPKIKTDNIQTTDGLAYTKDSDVVHLTGAETIAGIKTFSSIPVLPNSNPTADNELARKKYVDDNSIALETEPSTILVDSADTERTIPTDETNYDYYKRVTINDVSGQVTVKFDLKDDNGAGGCFGKVYVDGVAAGIEREETSGSWVTYSENFSVTSGQQVQLQCKYDSSGGGVGGACRNFRVYYRKNPISTAGTVNLD